ncbi:hypothetical protein SARC_15651, partial [Sphaeroforma arctica JP610]
MRSQCCSEDTSSGNLPYVVALLSAVATAILVLAVVFVVQKQSRQRQRDEKLMVERAIAKIRK